MCELHAGPELSVQSARPVPSIFDVHLCMAAESSARQEHFDARAGCVGGACCLYIQLQMQTSSFNRHEAPGS